MDTETENICRACLTEQGSFQSVFQAESNSGISLNISEMLTICANIQVTNGDGLPDQICILCAEVTVEMYLFKLRCEKSDKILRTRLEKLALRNEENFIIGSEAETVKQPVKSENIDNLQNETFIEDIKEFDSCDENKSDSNEEIKTIENNEEIAISSEDLTLKEFKCYICQKRFNQKNLLLNHNKDHFLKMNEIEIKYEGLQLNHNSINQPASKSEGESVFSHPEFFFDKKEYIDSHINSWHKKEPEASSNDDSEKKPIKTKSDCSKLIEKGFSKKIKLKDHLRAHNFASSYDLVGKREIFIHLPRLSEESSLCRPSTTLHVKNKNKKCNKRFVRMDNLNKHKMIHTGKKLYECDFCKKTFTQLGYLKIHRRIHTGEKPYECDICKKAFIKIGCLSRHKKIHTGEKPYECDTCNKRFTRMENLNKHQMIHTGKKPDKCKPYECDFCKKKFTHLGYLKVHKKIHTGEKPYECDICKKGFLTKTNLNNHKISHTGEKPYECDICKKKISQLGSLKTHKRIHTNERPYECDICKKTFIQLSNLKIHRRIHTGEKPYECGICKKTFVTMTNLKIHKMTHTGEKPYACNICEKKFTVLCHLKTHIRIHTNERPFECDICKKTFTQSNYLKIHKSFHTGEKPYECDICKKTFVINTLLNRHKRTHTGKKPYECDICKKRFPQINHLNKHKIIHTGEEP